MHPLAITAALLALAAASVAAVTDLKTGRIPNWLTLGALAVGVALGFTGQGFAGAISAAAAGLLAALVPNLLYLASAMGGGDVKLFAGLGALLGATAALETELLAFCLGGAYGIFLWIRRRELGPRLVRVFHVLAFPLSKRRSENAAKAATEIRFAPAILLAALVVIAGRLWSAL